MSSEHVPGPKRLHDDVSNHHLYSDLANEWRSKPTPNAFAASPHVSSSPFTVHTLVLRTQLPRPCRPRRLVVYRFICYTHLAQLAEPTSTGLRQTQHAHTHTNLFLESLVLVEIALARSPQGSTGTLGRTQLDLERQRHPCRQHSCVCVCVRACVRVN